MRLYFTFTRRRLLALFLVLVVVALISSRVCSANTVYNKGKTNSQRLEFMASIGITDVNETAAKKHIIIPTQLDEVFESYNEIQIEAGFDLSAYAGAELTMYTYELKSGLAAVHIITDGERIVGGDIAEFSVNGRMRPLLPQSGENKNGKAKT